MSTRYVFLSSCIFVISLAFFTANRSTDLGVYLTAAIACSIIATSISALSLAFFTLKSMSLLYVTRAAIGPLLIASLLNNPPTLVLVTLLATIGLHASFFSEILISRCAREIGKTNEDMFILRSPASVNLWFTFTWTVLWATLIESIHLFGTGRNVLGTITAVIGLVIFALFIPSQLRILQRRCVIVPAGVVISDAISMTDVVLVPLSKISTIELVPKIEIAQEIPDETFSAVTSNKNAVTINLNEATDSLIARVKINETERKQVNQIQLTIADAKRFVSTFHSRFHKIEPEELTRSQEIIAEKQLGIDTSVRSDSPLPQHRPKKNSKN